MKSEYDVIVVGAGPAGSVAAKAAASQGLDVLLIEKRQEIGEPVRCAEAIIKDGLYDYIEHDPRWICAEIKAGRIYAPDGSVLNLTQKSNGTAGFILDRKIFDRALAREAARAGAEVLVKTQTTSLIRNDGVINGIKGVSAGKEFEARSKIVIGADGVESKIGMWAGILKPLGLKDIESCVEFTVSDIDIDNGCCELHFGNHISPGGYSWVFPKGKGEANIGLGILGTRYTGTPAVEYLKKFVGDRFPDGKINRVIYGAVPVCDFSGNVSTGGLMLAGDGARLVDPLLGAGILNAMVSGKIAGSNAVEAIRKGDVSAEALRQYDREINESIGKAIHRNYGLKEIIVNASDSRMNFILHGIKRMNVENVPISSLYNSLMSPKMFNVTRAFFSPM